MYSLLTAVVISLCFIAPAKADQFRSMAEIYRLAETVTAVDTERRQLGLDWAGPQERHFSAMFRRPWSCVNVQVQTAHGERFNAALCMPATCRSLHPNDVITFYPALRESARQGWSTVAFVTDQQMQYFCDHAHRARGIRGEGWQRRGSQSKKHWTYRSNRSY